MRPLTELEKRFIDELVRDPQTDLTGAARRAGKTGSPGSIRKWAHDAFNRPIVKAELERRREEDPGLDASTVEKRPSNWELRVQAAYLLMTLRKPTDVAVAAQLGITDRTLYNWRQHPSWPTARQEAQDRWCYRLDEAARAAVIGSVEAGNATLGWEVLQRLDDKFAPKQKHEHSGKLEHQHTHEVTTLSYAELVARRNAALQQTAGAE